LRKRASPGGPENTPFEKPVPDQSHPTHNPSHRRPRALQA
jgi:hypothetical protein